MPKQKITAKKKWRYLVAALALLLTVGAVIFVFNSNRVISSDAEASTKTDNAKTATDTDAVEETEPIFMENVQPVVPQKTVTVGQSTVSFTDRYPEIPKPNFNEEFFTEMTASELCEYYGLTMVKEYLKTGDFIEITDENTRHGVYNLPDGNVYDINTFTFETPDNIIREKRVTLTVGKHSFFGQEFFPEAEYGTGKIKYDDYYNEDEGIFFNIFEKNGLCMMVSAKVDEIANFDDQALKKTFYSQVVHDVNDEEFWQGVPPEYHFFAQAVYECSRTDPWDIGYDDWNPDWDDILQARR